MPNVITPNIKNSLLREVGPDEPQTPPDGVLSLTPYRTVRTFIPNDKPEKYDWLEKFENKYIKKLGEAVAFVFGVSLLNDKLYSGGSEYEKKSLLSVVLTRSEIAQIRPGIWAWFPIVVVAATYAIVLIEAHLDPANDKIIWPKALLWSNKTQRYELVIERTTNMIPDPFVLPNIILPKYIAVEKW